MQPRSTYPASVLAFAPRCSGAAHTRPQCAPHSSQSLLCTYAASGRALLIERLRHYFLTYKLVPGTDPDVRIDEAYGREHALTVIRAAIEDYDDAYGA